MPVMKTLILTGTKTGGITTIKSTSDPSLRFHKTRPYPIYLVYHEYIIDYHDICIDIHDFWSYIDHWFCSIPTTNMERNNHNDSLQLSQPAAKGTLVLRRVRPDGFPNAAYWSPDVLHQHLATGE